MAGDCVSDYLRSFRSRREYCRALLELSHHQDELIAADAYGELLEVLGQKQRILARFDEFNRLSALLWRSWKLDRDGLDPEVRSDCEHVLAETEAILAELVEHERQSSTMLVERKDETERQLRAIVHGSEAHDAYRQTSAVTTHRHLDVGR